MKTKIISSQPMRTITLLLLFVSGFAFAQPAIVTPPPLQMCDYNNDTFETWDLTLNQFIIINGDNTLFVNYYETLTDSQTMSNPIANPTAFVNISPSQTIYVSVIDPIDPGNPAFTSFDLVLVTAPTVNTPPNMTYVDIPFDGQATFDLTTQDAAITTDIISQTGMFDGNFNVSEINGPSTKSENDFGKEDVKTIQKQAIKATGNKLTYSFPAHSITMIKGTIK